MVDWNTEPIEKGTTSDTMYVFEVEQSLNIFVNLLENEVLIELKIDDPVT
jgi:hypothetical protein